MRPQICAHKGNAAFAVSSETPGAWSLTKQGREPCMHITLACSTSNAVVSTLATNDAYLVKRTLDDPGHGLVLRSFQVVFSCDFPDNNGVGVADVYELTEAKTKQGEIFHQLSTKFCTFRIGGPAELMASQVKFGSEVVLYTAVRPSRRRHYYES